MASQEALDQLAIEWLLASDEPGIRMQAGRDLLGVDASAEAAQVLDGPTVRRLFAGQQPDGGFGVNVYSKWKGAHWRLVSLVELGVAAGEPRALAAVETVLRWLTGKSHRAAVLTIEGRVRRCASQEGNALAVMSRLGMAHDPRASLLANALMEWQWPDGGWNCARRPATTHSSFYETITPMWGLTEYARATGDSRAATAARRTAEFFLAHRIFRSHTTGRIADPRWVEIHYPPYYTYDILQGLTVLGRAGALPDPRADEAIDLLLEKRLQDGRWPVEGAWAWRSSNLGKTSNEPAEWEQHGPSEMVTLNALRILRQAGRRPPSPAPGAGVRPAGSVGASEENAAL
jgi:hypothetical protein